MVSNVDRRRAAGLPSTGCRSRAAAPYTAGDPAILGLPIFAAGSVALAFALVGYVLAAQAVRGQPIAIILAATGVGLLISTVWAIALGQTLVACIFGLFAGFWLSYGMLVLGLNHNWSAIPRRDVAHTVAEFQITWAIVIGRADGGDAAPARRVHRRGRTRRARLRAPHHRHAGHPSETMTKAGGYVCFVFAALGLYLFLGAASVATDGKGYPLGRPIVR